MSKTKNGYFDNNHTLEFIRDYYDRRMARSRIRDFYGDSDYFNYGYWESHTTTPKDASENLVAQLLSFLPEKRGRILDVACGMGATTQYLLRHFDPADVVGINISGDQLERCRRTVPECSFILMDAATLAFPDAFFDHVICVESVFHFHSREKFLAEALRVLKPGGSLVLSDILFPAWVGRSTSFVPAENYVADLTDYEATYHRAGFDSVRVIDATGKTWHGFRRNLIRTAWSQYRVRKIDERILIQLCIWLLLTLTIRRYLLVAAYKGGEGK